MGEKKQELREKIDRLEHEIVVKDQAISDLWDRNREVHEKLDKYSSGLLGLWVLFGWMLFWVVCFNAVIYGILLLGIGVFEAYQWMFP